MKNKHISCILTVSFIQPQYIIREWEREREGVRGIKREREREKEREGEREKSNNISYYIKPSPYITEAG